MASIVKRKSKYSVVYDYTDENGKRRQRWETFSTNAEAKKRKKQIEYEQDSGTFFIPTAKTLNDLLDEYMSIYGVNTWAMSTYESRRGLARNYITPIIGDMLLSDITPRMMDKYFNKLIKENGLPHVVFHSLRHSSITYKLKLNGGDMKSVQGDSGHAQVKMVADVYSHIIDEDRCINAQRLEEAFYSSKTPDPVEDTEPETADTAVTESDESDAVKILELLKNPETAALLKQLAKAL